MKILIFTLFVCGVFSSCKTTKFIDRETVRIDSSMYEQNEGLQHALLETIQTYEAQREDWTKAGILFDTVYKDTGSLRVLNKITFYDNGKLKTAEGRILAVNTDLHEKTAELLDAHATIDELSLQLDKAEAQLSRKETSVVKQITKTRAPFWLWLLIFAAGILARHFWPKIKSFVLYYVKP